MTMKRRRQPDLSNLKRFRGWRWYLVVHPQTGAVSFWNTVRSEGKVKKTYLTCLPGSTPKAEVERFCEELGCPPPWIPREERPSWRADWFRRHPQARKPKLPRTRVVNVQNIDLIPDAQEDDPVEEMDDEMTDEEEVGYERDETVDDE